MKSTFFESKINKKNDKKNSQLFIHHTLRVPSLELTEPSLILTQKNRNYNNLFSLLKIIIITLPSQTDSLLKNNERKENALHLCNLFENKYNISCNLMNAFVPPSMIYNSTDFIKMKQNLIKNNIISANYKEWDKPGRIGVTVSHYQALHNISIAIQNNQTKHK